jgi:ubiquinone/menaquinone biosynthesis C-methylase UbiE
MQTLDVGCGDRPAGNVNLDRFYYGKGENFVIAEAHYLPFKNGSFDKIYAKHCLEHFDNPFKFFKEAKRLLRRGGVLECVYPTDVMLTKKTIHNLLNLRWSSAFKWKSKITGDEKITYGGHKWQLHADTVYKLLRKAGFTEIVFHKIRFPTIRVDKDCRKRKWKNKLNKYLPTWQIETKFVATI